MRTIAALMLLAAAPLVMAQAPAPAPDAAAQAKAEQAAARKAWETKRSSYLLCQAQDAAAENYRSNAQAAGKPALQPIATPPCEDPGSFEEAKPREVSGAHSPADTADTPPSQRETEAEINGGTSGKPADKPTGDAGANAPAPAAPASAEPAPAAPASASAEPAPAAPAPAEPAPADAAPASNTDTSPPEAPQPPAAR